MTKPFPATMTDVSEWLELHAVDVTPRELRLAKRLAKAIIEAKDAECNELIALSHQNVIPQHGKAGT